MKNKKLAIIGSGRMAWIIGKNAKEMGVETHCFSFDEHAIARETVDYFHDISIKEKEHILDVCQAIGIDGVVATTELTIPVAAYIAENMHLNGIDYDVSKLITDKVRNRKLCAGIQDLHQPWFQEVKSITELHDVQFPVIVKPTSLGGKRGISVANNEEELKQSFEYAREAGPIENILVEQFLEGGKEYSVESLSYKGQHSIIQVTEKISSGPPHCVELGHQQPADISVDLRETIRKVLTEGLTAIGVANGPCHTEIKIIDGKIYLIEFNARPGGDHIAYPLTELSTGFPYIKGIIEVALDDFKGVDVNRLKHHYAGVYFVTEQTAYLKPIFDKCDQYDWLYLKNEVTKDLQPLVHNDGYNTNFMMYYSKGNKPTLDDMTEKIIKGSIGGGKNLKTQQKLLMLGTSSISCEMVKYAKSKGIYTIVTDPREPEKSVAKLIADEYWMINTGEIELLEKKCREEGVTAVICGISEFCLEVCMELCKRLGFPCYCTPEAWHYSRDKEDFKKLCKEVGAPVATDYYLTDALTDEELSKVQFPVVVKPVDMSGNRGVSYCYNKQELIDAWKYARSISKSSKMIVERMLHGEEWYSSYAFSNGEPRLLALNAMYAQPGEPKNCYTVTTTVSNHVEQYIKEINPQILEVLKRVGCKEGYAWVQAMLDEDGHFYIIEMGYRLDGDQMFMPYRDMLNYDIVKELVDMACGKKSRIEDLPPSQEHAYKKCGCGLELWTNKDGILTEIKGLDVMENTPGVFVECLHQIGDTIVKYRPLANISFTTDTIDEMCDLIDKVNKEVAFYNEKGEDTVIKYTDFDYLKRVYQEGLEGK